MIGIIIGNGVSIMTVQASLDNLKQSVDTTLTSMRNRVVNSAVTLYVPEGDVFPGDVVEIKIPSYDGSIDLTPLASLGAAELIDNGDGTAVVRYTAPNDAGEDSVTIAGKGVGMSVRAKHIVKPVIESLTDGQVDVPNNYIVSTSTFVSKPAGEFTHEQTQWQVALDIGFTNIVDDRSSAGTFFLETYPLSALDAGGTYYIRHRHLDNTAGVISEWSDALSFTMAVSVVQGNEIAKLLASDGAGADYFGHVVSLSGDGTVALIGAYRNDDHGSNSGSAYIFENQGGVWVEVQKLTASDASSSDYFGYSVSLSTDGSTALIGAYDDDNSHGSGSGAAYIFENQGGAWVEVQKLTASDGDTSDFFGHSVDLTGDGVVALIGAYGDDDNDTTSGSAYIFENQAGTWVEVQKLTASDGAAGDQFGSAVSLSADGSTALIGAYSNDDLGNASGSVYVFESQGGTWAEVQKLTPSDGVGDDYFGYDVCVSGNGSTALIGAYNGDDHGTDSGSAYIFENQGGVWVEVQKLTASDASSSDYFGKAVSLSGDGAVALIGAHGDDDLGNASGAAYIFENQGGVWVEVQKLTASDGVDDDYFGYDVCVSGNGSTALIGAFYSDTLGSASGSAYVFN